MATAVPHKLCSHLQNVSRANIARTPVPFTTVNLGISNVLLRHGLISNVTLGTPSSPDPTSFQDLATKDKRIWLDMKYRGGLPVMRRISLVSKSSLRKHVTREELGRILTGKRARNIASIGVGEILVVRTPPDKDAGLVGRDCFMDGWQAWRAGLGGEVICRAG